MAEPSERQLEGELRRLAKVKQRAPRETPMIGGDLVAFFKQNVEKRQAKFGKIAECWGKLVPEILDRHCALESFHRGQLTVLVDSSPHLYELRQLLLSGLEKQLLVACKAGGLRKVVLKPGRWYEAGEDGVQKIRFD